MFKDIHSLYIHWPFCSSKCYYCDFVALEQHEDFQSAYHAALIKEIELFSTQQPDSSKKIKTIFIGGGTPSLYPLDLMEQLFATLRTHFDFSQIQEISMEANPADITEERLDAWESFGITRISMGVQILDDTVLFKLNRRQRTRDVERAAQLVPKYFSNYSMDLILGLPGVSAETWFSSLEQIIAWTPKHISIYFLTIHEKTPLYYKVQRRELTLPEEDLVLNTYEKTVNLLDSHGFEQYEISNFAQSGHASLHNKAYWDRLPYKGFGIGACSFDLKNRTTNEKNLENYIKSLLIEETEAISFHEQLSLQQEKIESLMLTLRQNKGGGLHRMVYLIEEDKKQHFYATLQKLEKQGLLKNENDTIKLTIKGMMLENEIIMQLM